MSRRSILAVAGVLLAAACGSDGGRSADPPVPTATLGSLSTPTPAASPVAGPLAFAVGGVLVSRSDDEGASWRDIFNAGSGGVWGVDFIDRATGWIVGGRAIYRTTTGGRVGQWQEQSANVEGPPVDLYDVAFVDAARGVAVGRSERVNGGAVALVTSDGGMRWRRVSLGPFGTEGPGRTWLTRVCLSSDGPGLVVGSGLVRGVKPLVLTTGDLGESWANVTAAVQVAAAQPLTVANCARLPSSTLWVVGAPSFLAESVDGGATWARRSVTARPDVLLNAILFADSEHGWVSGYDGATREILLFRTQDGGASWEEQVLAGGVQILEQQPSAALATLGPGALLFVGDDPNSFALEGARALSFVSRDGGATWTPSTIPGGFHAFWDIDVVR